MEFKDAKLKIAALFDTNIWIALGAAPSYLPKLMQLNELRKSGKLHVVIPEILAIEYGRHREQIAKGWKNAITRKIDLSDLRRIVPDASQQIAEIEKQLLAIVKPAMDAEPESIAILDEILDKPTCGEINEKRLAAAARRAVDKKAPSHGKDSVADALLWDTACDHLPKYNVLFVTANKTDFGDPKDGDALHPDLAADAAHSTGSLIYLRSVDPVIEHFEALKDKVEFQPPIEGYWFAPQPPSVCPNCEARDSYTGGAYLRSQYGGLTLQYTCQQCGYRFDTGDSFD